ncbi:squalene/phytoene synthase family protein [Microvirga rosea]|uniref:squalene/phytoene synthase family protein n=1 Tax=Microvirga rosea TaxID=2715425 RepID=UPI001D0B2520|nr:squalene/phytoene synthase family protein [Microvirga rosea]MCB8822987.1 squalene/phytoene synthase family protein [Microvirga rosea]
MRGSSDSAGKQPSDEGFPVASLILARSHRSAVLAFYNFARFADDIADSPHFSSQEKLERLTDLEAALIDTGSPQPKVSALHAVNERFGTGVAEAYALLQAFKQDAFHSRYNDWDDLIDYCRLSANPVGRFLLRIHKESHTANGPADALCTTLQILNHLQDLSSDKKRLNRVYIPATWISKIGGEAIFFDPSQLAPRRQIIDAVLDRITDLLHVAASLPNHLSNPRLRAQSIATLDLARSLHRKLRVHDPLIQRVSASKLQAGFAFLKGLAGSLNYTFNRDASLVAATVAGSHSSFQVAMRSLDQERRRAIYAVYSVCRRMDDIADGGMPAHEKRRFLDEWRREIDAIHKSPRSPVGRELQRAAANFNLPTYEFHTLLDGMETDCSDQVRLESEDDLERYTRQVAGSVGALSIYIFGLPQETRFAIELGKTLQLVNILRDIDEDAKLDRVYVPLSRLSQAGLADAPAHVLIADPRFCSLCEGLAAEASCGFARADEALSRIDRTAVKPAILMMENYRRILGRLQARGWRTRGDKLRLKTFDRLYLLGRAMGAA